MSCRRPRCRTVRACCCNWTTLAGVAVGVFIKSGSRYETDESNGSAHFLEHMFFKGSKNTTQGMLEKKVEQMGC